MTADTFDPILGLLLMGTGNDNNAWGDNANNSDFKPIARSIAGYTVHHDTTGTLDLSVTTPPAGLSSAIDFCHAFDAAPLTGNLTVILPAVPRLYAFANLASGAHSIIVHVNGDATNVEIPQNTVTLVLALGGLFALRLDDSDIGRIDAFAQNVAPSGYMLCNGASLVRADHPSLFTKIGTTWGAADGTHFTLPNLTDTGRFLRAGGGFGPAVGTYQANQNLAHSHTVTGAPSAGTLGTDSQGAHTHAATVTDSGHNHSIPFQNSGTAATAGVAASGFPTYVNGSTQTTSTSITGITVSNATNGAHSHNITGAPGLGTLGTGSSGGSEARPEAAAVLMCIRY